MVYLFMYMYISSLLSLLIVRQHIFLCLLSLEFIVMVLMIMVLYFTLFFSYGFYLMMLIMVFFVCEGVLGLSVLVSMIRCHGNDYLSSMNLW